MTKETFTKEQINQATIMANKDQKKLMDNFKILKEFDDKFAQDKNRICKWNYKQSLYCGCDDEVKTFIKKSLEAKEKEVKEDLIKKIEGKKRTATAELASEKDIIKRDNYFYNLALKEITNLIKK